MKRTTMSVGRRASYARVARTRFDKHEAELRPAIEKAMAAYLALVRKKLDRHLTAAAAQPDDSPDFTDDDASALGDVLDEAANWSPIMDAQIMPTYQRVLDQVLQHGLADPRISTDLTKWRNQWLAQRTQVLLGVPDAITGQLRTELQGLAAKDGTSVDDARTAVQNMLDMGYQSWQSRADLIARTETVGANNQGSLASWSILADATGQQAEKTWLATDDERTRQDHADVDGMSVGITENFDVGGTPMNGPGDDAGGAEQVCNCRCTMTYSFPDGTESDTPPAEVAGDGDMPPDDGSGDGTGDALTAAAAVQSGVALMLGLDITSEQECTAAGVEADPPGLHCTVAYLAQPAANYSDEQKAALVTACADLGGSLPLLADAFATAHFNPDDPERAPCAVLLVQSDALNAFHDAVGDMLATQLLDQSDAFPIWIPHVAIAYNADPSVIPPGAVGSQIGFNRLVLGWGGEQIVVAGDGAPDPGVQTEPELTAATEAPVTAPTTDAPPSEVAAPSATGGDTPAPELGTDLTPQGPTWSGCVALLDTPSGDGRIIASTGGIIRPLPLPLAWQRESDENHDGKVTVGRVLQVEQRGGELWAMGDWLDPMISYSSQEAIGLVDAQLGLVSVDLAITEAGFADATGTPIDPSIYEDPDDVNMVALAWEFGGVTIVDFPAFANARIQNDPDPDGDTGSTDMLAPIIVESPGPSTFAGANPEPATVSDDGTTVNLPDGSSVGVGDVVALPNDDGTTVTGKIASIDASDPANATVTVTPDPDDDGTQPPDVTVPVASLQAAPPPTPGTEGGDSLTASSEVRPYTKAFFQQRKLDGPTPLTINPETGEVYGHLATWGECHVGKLKETGQCVTLPEQVDYDGFHLGTVFTDDGELLDVGKVTVGTGHAVGGLGFMGAVEHYDNTGTQAAVVRAYTDEYGVQVTGQLIHDLPAAKVEELMRSPLSGDWRTRADGLELCAALAVNVPAFQVRGKRGQRIPLAPRIGLSRGGKQLSLVAAGVVMRPVGQDDTFALPSGKLVARADMESMVAAALEAIERRAVPIGGEAGRTALALARARMRLRNLSRVG